MEDCFSGMINVLFQHHGDVHPRSSSAMEEPNEIRRLANRQEFGLEESAGTLMY